MNVSFDILKLSCSKKKLTLGTLLSDATTRFAVNVHATNDQVSLHKLI